MKRVFLMLSMLTLGELKGSAAGAGSAAGVASKEGAEVEVWMGRLANHRHPSKKLISRPTSNFGASICFAGVKATAGNIALAELKKLGAAEWKADAEKVKFLRVSQIVEFYDDANPSRGTYTKAEKNVEWQKGYVKDASVALSERCMFLMLDEQEQAHIAKDMPKETAAAPSSAASPASK